MNQEPVFTPQAARKWAALDPHGRTLIINEVWCTWCTKTTTIVKFKGHLERGDLILRGHCIRCDGKVARLIECG